MAYEKVAFLTEILGRVTEDKEMILSPNARKGLYEILCEINDELCAANSVLADGTS